MASASPSAQPVEVPPVASPPGDVTQLRGRVEPWGRAGWLLIALFALVGLGLRIWNLSAEGFADDEVHKWLAAVRYLHGDFGGDDVEHPMLMKLLVALFTAVLPKSVAPETLTRLPNAVAGAVVVVLTAQLGRRLYGRAVGLLGAAIYAVSATVIGYGRIAKEDTLLGLFLIVLLWCFAEAKAAADDGRELDQRRWEQGGAAALAGMLVSKYLIFLFPIPLLVYGWLRTSGTTWKVPFRRWVALTGLALVIFLAVNWVVLLPETWRYLVHYIIGDKIADRASSESILFMGRLYNNLAFHHLTAPPVWFHLVFLAVKLAPPTVLFAAAGLTLALRRRAPADRIVLVWIGFFFLAFAIISAKYARYAIPILPAFTLLAAHGAAQLAAWMNRRFGSGMFARAALPACAALLVAAEARATWAHAPHERLYINALGGGDARLDYFFPHCDYFDAGVREAVQRIAAKAEPGAEIATEVTWVARYYADLAGRSDLVDKPFTQTSACRQGRVCYVIAQTGRLYWHNQAALEQLAQRAPWATEEVAGRPVIRIYRLEPGEALFPPGSVTTEGH